MGPEGRPAGHQDSGSRGEKGRVRPAIANELQLHRGVLNIDIHRACKSASPPEICLGTAHQMQLTGR